MNLKRKYWPVKLTTKIDVAYFVEKTDFDGKLGIISKKVTFHKRRKVQANKELHELSEKVTLISTKGLTKDLINKYSTFNGAKHFSKNGLQNYFVYVKWALTILNYLQIVIQLKSGNLKIYQIWVLDSILH